ncbi:MAG: hypothetical protein Q8P20_01660 [bacterium]|nr:hypothetical protein [bacterium]
MLKNILVVLGILVVMAFMILVWPVPQMLEAPATAAPATPTTDVADVHTERFNTLIQACLDAERVPEGNAVSGEVKCLPAPVVEQIESPSTPLPTAEPTTSESLAQGAGTLASDQPTNMNGYQASPIGGLTSSLPLLCETWGPIPEGGNRGFVVTVPAGSIMWEQYHYGGSCWWVDPNDLDNTVQRSVTNITNRDGVIPIVVRLPVDTFPLLGCLQSTPVDGSVRHCDPVGGLNGFDTPVNLPIPGYFSGYAEQ